MILMLPAFEIRMFSILRSSISSKTFQVRTSMYDGVSVTIVESTEDLSSELAGVFFP